jgi:hypothetical protein
MQGLALLGYIEPSPGFKGAFLRAKRGHGLFYDRPQKMFPGKHYNSGTLLEPANKVQ